MKKFSYLFLGLALIAAACGDDDTTTTTAPPATEAPASTEAPAETTTTVAATTTAPPESTTTAAPETTQAAADGVLTHADGTYTIDWDALEGSVFYAPPAAGSADPFYFLHTDPAVDGFYFSIEAYTTGYGTAWAGELGTFPIDCTPGGTGICVHFDPDGPGPVGDLGADFLVSGDVEFVELGDEGLVAVVSNVTFTDGSTIPGPLTVTG